jgi:hypothetical protein
MLPTPGFDPYGDPTAPQSVPGATTSPYVTDPYTGAPAVAPPAVAPTYQPAFSTIPFGQWPRFLQQLRFRYTWIQGSGTNNVGFNDFELSGTFYIPFLFNPQAPLLVTPGFALHTVNGPGINIPPAPYAIGADLPPQLYDAFLDFGWTPIQTPYGMSADLGFRVGIYSDFSKVDTDAIRYMGRAFGVWKWTETHEWRAGVVYIDRVGLKLLPAGGLIWTPGGANGDVRWEILFPNPKLAWRLNSWRTNDIWWYVAGEYGGGSWNIERVAARVPPVGTNRDRFDYNDFRIIMGFESRGHAGLKWLIEGGYVFHRDIDYVTNNLDFSPDSTFFLRTGLTY